MKKAARDFLKQCYAELGLEKALAKRWREVRAEIDLTGTYTHTSEELTWGARVAWRNHARCIGRLFWKSLTIFDRRELEEPEDVARACFEHVLWSTNGGLIRPAITVFRPRVADRPDVRIENAQLISYAGFPGQGDPLRLAFTEKVQALGWKGAAQDFAVLPLCIEGRLFPLPEDIVLEVPLSHPDWPGMAEWGMRWYALPAVSDMEMEIGGIVYTAAPFSGYYMVTEVGSRDLGDRERYNVLPRLAEEMGYRDQPLWQDRAICDINRAVLHSYQKAGVTMVDHHTASDQFMRFCALEGKEGREVPGDWSWLVPPTAGSASPIFSMRIKNFPATPAYRKRKSMPHLAGVKLP